MVMKERPPGSKGPGLSSVWTVMLLLLAMPGFAAGSGTATAPAHQDFQKRVAEYVELRDGIARQLPGIKKDADSSEILLHRRLLAERVRAARKGARQGDIFFVEIRQEILRTVRGEVRGAEGQTAKRAVLEEGNPKTTRNSAKVRLKVNGDYPDEAPLSSVPAVMLLKLPPLPDGLEYRFVGRHLILHDARANLIVDYIEDVIP